MQWDAVYPLLQSVEQVWSIHSQNEEFHQDSLGCYFGIFWALNCRLSHG